MASRGAGTQTTILRRRLYQLEIELTQIKQELNLERQAREHAAAKARNAARKTILATQKLSAAEAELGATRVAYHACFLCVIVFLAFILLALL